MEKLSPKKLLSVSLVIASIFLIYGIANQDLIGDEATYSFRSIGYLDYLGTSFQTQPVDWYVDQPLPSWTKLSFHDHPPLGFLVQHFFFRIFGDSIFTTKLPSVLAGLGSIYLLYLIARKLFDEQTALIAAFLASINGVFVSIFRTSLLEPVLIFFILLNVYLFLKLIENPGGYWLPFGLSFGLVILTKYNGIFLAPLYFLYLVVYKRGLFKDWRLYASALVAVLVFSPVLVYNYYLYRERGHFDLQFAYLLGQATPEWTGLLGKIQSPFSDIAKNLTAFYGWGFLGASLLGALYLSRYRKANFWFLFFYLLSATLLFVKIGVANRFLALYLPAFLIFSAVAANWLWNFKKESVWNYAFKASVLAFVVFEIFFAYHKNFVLAEDYGVAELDNYLTEEFRGKESAVIPESDNPNLNEVIYKFAERKNPGAIPEFLMIVYNDNVALATLEWIYYRRFFYHNIPALFIENFIRALQVQGEDYFKGFQIYFVQSTENTDLNPFKTEKSIGEEFERNLINLGHSPVKIIYGKNGLEMFRVYKFSL